MSGVPAAFFLESTLDVARALLGMLLVRESPDGRLVGRIVETEAYGQADPACHSVRQGLDGTLTHRQTARNTAMFGPPGRVYVYFTYGNHFMLNVVTQPAGTPEAVLIRALEPLEGLERMCQLRGLDDPIRLTNGPGKLAKAFAIDGQFNGHDLAQPPLQLLPGAPVPDENVVTAPRIGITRAADWPWRFYERGNPWVSRVL
jgi:DNA-3-methyladenine glycosylase